MAKLNDDTLNCVIGEGSIFEGKFFVNGSIHIKGKFQGEIKTEDQLIVGPTGKVKTDIYAKRVTIAGTIIGNITASEEVNLKQSGMILGNIKTPKLNVEQGVISHGEVTLTSESSNNVKKLIMDSFGKNTEEELQSSSKAQKTQILEQEK